MPILKLYYNAFWPGFYEGTDPVTLPIFLELLSKALDAEIEVTVRPADADILLESLFGTSILATKTWKYSIFFSGEQRICPQYKQYDCVLWGELTQGNVVCCSEFIPYIYSTGLLTKMENVSDTMSQLSTDMITVPKKTSICAVISNGGGSVRNQFLDILGRYLPVEYAGRFRTNVGPIMASYTSEEFSRFVGQYRCMIAMENSRGEAYVTEKITHAMLAGVVPIYWGAPGVVRIFNPARFIHLKELDADSINETVNQIMAVLTDDDYFRAMVSQPIFVDGTGNPSHRLHRNLDAIAADMRLLLVGSGKVSA
jgi:hypothetical protein